MSENADMFTDQDETYLVFTPKNKIFFLIYTLRKIQKTQPNFSPGQFSYGLTFSVCLVIITLSVNKFCT